MFVSTASRPKQLIFDSLTILYYHVMKMHFHRCFSLFICFIGYLGRSFLQHGSVYKLAFGPKAFIVVSDPIVARHILRENAFSYDKVCSFLHYFFKEVGSESFCAIISSPPIFGVIHVVLSLLKIKLILIKKLFSLTCFDVELQSRYVGRSR